MKIFNLPDLGEGLPDAEIREWYVSVGDTVAVDQPLVAMETAKALVDVPSPYAGKIEQLFGEVGDTIDTEEPLIGFEGEGVVEVAAAPEASSEAAAEPENWQELSKTQRAMVLSMSQSHSEVVPVTLCDDADISSWAKGQNITLRLIRAVQAACQAEPMLNAHFNGKDMTYLTHDHVHLGIAVDTPHGLYVPVLRDVANQSDAELREHINNFKQQAQDKAISADDQKGATILLSNFGTIAGRYANPVVVPPMTCIVGVGRLSMDAVTTDSGAIEAHRVLPISVTVDHRAVTGGEVARFLRAMIDSLAVAE